MAWRHTSDTDPHLLAMLAIAVVVLLMLAPRLLVPDLVVDYPHMGGDSQDWIANGLHIAGFDVHYSVRPPVLPLVIAGAERLSLLELLPVGLLALAVATSVLLYLWLRDRCRRSLALVVAVAILANFSWLGLSLQVMADVPASCLLFAGTLLFARGLQGDARWYPAAGALLGVSAATQQLALLFVIPALATLAIHRRDHLRHRLLWVGAAAFVAPFLLWTVYKLWAFGTAGDAVIRNWSLLGIHVHALGSSLLSVASLFGVPGALLAAFGWCVLLVDGRRRPADLLVSLLLATIVVFFVFLYHHHSKRLLAYIVPLSGLPIAAALARASYRPLRYALAALLLTTSVMPLPAPPANHRWAALWPVPPVYLHSLGRHAARVAAAETGSIRIERLSLAETVASSVISATMTSHRAVPSGERVDYRRFGLDDSVVWLHDDTVTPRDRYQRGLRLGNVLRKRVRHVSLDDVESLLGFIEWRPVTDFEDLSLHRARPLAVDGNWLLAVKRGGAADARLMAATVSDTGANLAARDDARRIAEIAGKRPVVVVTGADDPPPSLVYLPFLLWSPEFFVLDREAFDGAAEFFGAGPPAGPLEVGAATLATIDVLGRPWLMVEYE